MEDSSIVKGKRTKRKRLQLSSAAAAVAAGPSTSASAEFSENTTEEEEDTAKCLILLARGRQKPEPNVTEVTTIAVKSTSRRFIEAATTTSGRAGVFVYECKTCHKCFSSFQALGGHRASHKNPKYPLPSASADETKTAAINEDSIQLSMNSFPLQVAAKARIHVCSICGTEFKSGQALGGHMRRHRPASNLHEPAAKKERISNGLSLDLNLPPPSDDDADFANSSSTVSAKKTPPFSFAKKMPVLLLASSLLDCHY